MTKKYKINLLDLFSGIGGFHLGLKKAGFKVNSYFSEIDKYAIEVYKYNFKNSNYVKSVTDVRGDELPKIDAITFGSPCQDFSIAGKGKGLKGNRSSLISEAIRLISECRPSFFIWENVKGTFSSNNGEDFWSIIQAFANIGGYRLEWQLLNTNWFLPQNRERLYLVGYTSGQSRGQIFPVGQSLGEATNEIDIIGDTNKGGQRGAIHSTKGIVSALSATDYKQPKQIAAMRGRNLDNPSERRSGQPIIVNHNCLTEAIGRQGSSKEYINSLKKINKSIGYVRRLTPIECERLQGFQDNWTQTGVNGPISDTQRYKMCGNAVTVDVVEAVGQRIKNVLY